jgi:hypothetical protein
MEPGGGGAGMLGGGDDAMNLPATRVGTFHVTDEGWHFHVTIFLQFSKHGSTLTAGMVHV